MSDEHVFESPAQDTPASATTAWQMLREGREARGLSVAEVAQHLKLTPRQVEAMEAGDMAHLPGPAFARGFVRNYARFLNLDAAHFNAVLDVVREAPLPMNAFPLGQMPSPTRWNFSFLPALGVAAALLALAVAGWHYGWFEPRDEQYLADVMAQSAGLAEPVSAALAVETSAVISTQSAPQIEIVAASAVLIESASVAAATVVADTTPVAVPIVASAPRAIAVSSVANVASAPVVLKAPSAPMAQSSAASSSLAGPVPKGSHRLRFGFDADAWVEVRDANGKIVFSRLNVAGTEQEVQGAAPLQVVIGNAPQVRLKVDGKATELASHTTSNVARLSLP